MKKLVTFCLFAALIAFTFSVVLPAYAVPAETPGAAAQRSLGEVAGAAGITQTQTIEQMVGTVINIVLGLIGIIMIVLIVYAGFLWMTAGGEPKKVDKAKTILTDAIIGLVITLAAYSITYFVITKLIPATTG